MGETEKRPLQLSFISSLRVEFQGARVIADGGLILVSESRIGRTRGRYLRDSRWGRNIQLPLADPAAAVGPQPTGRL